MKIAVLFDGAGLARLGLEQAGHECVGYELDPAKHYLSLMVGSGNCVLADATKVDLSGYDGVWASPPCQERSWARTQGNPISKYATDYVDWCLRLTHTVLWVENVMSRDNTWGLKYNAAQFLQDPIQNRCRIIGGRYEQPKVYREYKRFYKNLQICPAITATEYKGCATDKRRASRYYGRRLSLEECAYHQGFTIPSGWYNVPDWWKESKTKWLYNLYESLGNGVPTFMSRAFGSVYS